MGCDIHLQVKGLRGGAWEFVQIKPFLQWGDAGFSWDADPTERFYRLFAFLAGVRMASGVGYLCSGQAVPPLLAGRGLPSGYANPIDRLGPDEDIDEAQEHFPAGDIDIGDHSYTHATLRELLDVPWPDFQIRGDDNEVFGAGLDESAFVQWLSSPTMQRIADEYGGAENVRIVIGFDN